MKIRMLIVILLCLQVGVLAQSDTGEREPYRIVDTGQIRCYDARTETTYPPAGAAFFGQDAHYLGHEPAYVDNGDGTVTDRNTGLMWQADPGAKRSVAEARAGATKCRTGGHADWRLPSIKELYSLILFSGTDPDPMSQETGNLTPFIDAKFFQFAYGGDGERIIDSQYASSTRYVGTTMGGNATAFGVNFADGRIKGYPEVAPHGRSEPQGPGHPPDRSDPEVAPHGRSEPQGPGHPPDRSDPEVAPHGRGEPQGPGNPPDRSDPEASPRGRGAKLFCVMYVRGNPDYGKNDFVNNGDGTVTDRATGLTWMQVDSGALKAGREKDGKLNWQEALAFAEGLEYAGQSDWRLPNAKELQSIVDYSRSPDTTKSAAIDPAFKSTVIRNEGGRKDYAHYWTSTTHVGTRGASAAVYIAFGRGLGFMSPPGQRDGDKELMDVHGAGCQRSDDKAGNPASFPTGRGPQGDVVRIENLVRCVRGGRADLRDSGPEVVTKPSSGRPERPDEGGEPGDRGPGGRPPSGEEFVRRLDRNDDGKVSRDEFDGPARHFDEFDENRDGYISAEEAPTGPPPRRR